MAVKQAPDADYARLTEQGLRETEATHRIGAGPRLADTPPPDRLSPAQKAEHLRQFVNGAFLHGAMRSPDGPIFDVPTFKAYLDDFLQRAGATGDPVKELLLQQVLQAHLAIGRLQVRGSASKSMDEAGACFAAAARFMAECRRHALALQVLRAGGASKKANDRSTPPPKAKKRERPKNGKAANKAKIHPRTEQGSNGHSRLKEFFHEPVLS